MKTKLLFTAALMSATMCGMQISYAGENNVFLNFLENLKNSKMDELSEGEIGEETFYNNCLINQSCTENITSWLRNSIHEGAPGFIVNADALYSEDYKGAGVEFFVRNVDLVADKYLLWQNIPYLPAGKYRVSAYATGRRQKAFGGNDDVDGTLYFFANDDNTIVDSNRFKAVSVETSVGMSGLKVGLKGGSNNKNHWVALSQVKVALLNTKSSLEEAIKVATEYNETIQNKNLTDAISKATDQLSIAQTNADYHKAIIDLNEVLFMANAEYCLNNPQDVSELIGNLDFNAGDYNNEDGNNPLRFDSWTTIGGIGGGAYGGFEVFDTSVTVSRKCVGLRNGRYRVSLHARANQDGEFVVFAQDTDGEVVAHITERTDDNAPGAGSVYERNMQALNNNVNDPETWTSLEVTVTNGVLNFGLRQNDNKNTSWAVYDGFKIEYLGAVLPDVFEAAKKNAKTFMEENVINQASKDYLNEYINLDISGYTDQQYLEAINELNKRLDEVNDIVDPYTKFLNVWNSYNDFNDKTIADPYQEEEFKKILDNSKEQVESTLAVSDIENKVVPLMEAVRLYASYVKDLAIDVDSVDVTFLLNNMDMSSDKVDPWGKEVADHTYDNFRAMAPIPNDLGLNIRFIECYINTNFVAECGNQKLVYQNVAGMPVGKYSFEAATFNRRQHFGASQEQPNAVKLFLNDASVDVNSQKFEYNEVIGGSNDGTLSFGIRSGAQFNTDWNGIGDTHLYYLGASDDIALDENNEEMGIKDTYGNVTVERFLKADGKWNTFCVPFAMTAEQLDANKITDVRKLISTEEKDGSVVLNFSDRVTEIEAGVPYIVKVSDAVSQITVNGVAVKVAEPAPLEVGSVNMLGNYGKINITGYDKYFISENKFYRAADKNIIVKGFRAYITMDQAAAGVNQMLINIDGNVTAIEDVLGEDVDATVNVYTIDGVCVKSGVKSSEALDGLRKGIYIVNGKKVVK